MESLGGERQLGKLSVMSQYNRGKVLCRTMWVYLQMDEGKAEMLVTANIVHGLKQPLAIGY